jgi:ribosomal protein S27AE
MKPITWRDLQTPKATASHITTRCRRCETLLAYRIRDHTYFRTDADAAAARRAIRSCPVCGQSLYRANLGN